MKIEIDTAGYAYPDVQIPQVWTIRQKIDAPALQDVESAARTAAKELLSDPRMRPGATVAVGVGSRGINNLVAIVRTTIGVLKAHGCRPFIVPAMGSHGGATAEGQAEVLHRYGITEEAVGAPIRATMEVAQVGALEDGYPVFFDCNALQADAVIVVCRIKPHTDFTGPIESGVAKMCAIGLGKRHGASRIHQFGSGGLRDIMPAVARKLAEKVNIVGGIAAIENPQGNTAEIHAVPAADVGRDGESALLSRARELMPRLPFDQIDVLVVDEMGKNISGAGMDTNVIGRLWMPSVPETAWHGPSVRSICVLDLTDETNGNACGLGLADFVTRRLIERTNYGITILNSRTSGEGGVRRMKLPLILEDAEACVKAAIGSCGRGNNDDVRLVRIRNTEFVETLEVSDSLMAEVRSRSDLEVIDTKHTPNLRSSIRRPPKS